MPLVSTRKRRLARKKTWREIHEQKQIAFQQEVSSHIKMVSELKNSSISNVCLNIIINTPSLLEQWNKAIIFRISHVSDPSERFLMLSQVVKQVDVVYGNILRWNASSSKDIKNIKNSAKNHINDLIYAIPVSDFQRNKLKSEILSNPASSINFRQYISIEFSHFFKLTKTAKEFAEPENMLELNLFSEKKHSNSDKSTSLCKLSPF